MPYRAIITSLWILWAGYWAFKAFGNKPTLYRPNRLWRLSLAVVALGLIVLFRHQPAIYGRRLLRWHPAIADVGIACCALGTAWAIWARAVLGRNWSGNPTIKEDHELVQTGPYRLVRHPIYTGLLLALLGTFLVGRRLAELVVLLAAILLFALKIRLEEALMRGQFPEAYRDYCRRTKALIPFLL